MFGSGCLGLSGARLVEDKARGAYFEFRGCMYCFNVHGVKCLVDSRHFLSCLACWAVIGRERVM